MKTKMLIVTVVMFLAGLALQSFSSIDYCEELFDSMVDDANTEYQYDHARCSRTWVSGYKCKTEAAYSYEQNITEAFYAFNECYNR